MVHIKIEERALRRALLACFVALVGALWAVPGQASGHATVRPGESRPADLQEYTLTVPNERESDTTEVALQVPDDIDFLLVDEAPGWRVRLEREGDRVAVVRWTGGTIAPDFYERLQFIARNPVREGVLEWKVNQRYQDGTTVRWIGAPGSDTPASRVQISESAAPQDVVSVHGDGEAASGSAQGDGGAETPAAAAETKVDERDELALIIAIVAAATALVACFLAVRSRRR
jgi:uncharacterized protein YcnI